MRLFSGIDELLTLEGASRKEARHVVEEDLSIVRDGAILEHGGQVLWAGRRRDSARAIRVAQAELARSSRKPNAKMRGFKKIELNVACVMPAFIESHTHLIFAGDRRHEFEMRNRGVTYQEIAQQGGGIRFTVQQTRAAKPNELLRLAESRAAEFCRQGVTTVEVKSGYGLTNADEIKILKVAKKIKSTRVVATYLGPHAVPKDKSRAEYMHEILTKTLPAIAKQRLAERVDMFVEEGYFTIDDAREYYAHAKKLGLRLTGHADQLSRTGAGALLADLDADCADHLVQASAADIQRLAQSSTTAVLLPASDFYLKIKYPAARELIDAGAKVALATDFNPGTSPTQDLSLVGVLARLEMKMTLSEVIAAYTIGAAHALGYSASLGSIEPGKFCDFVTLDGSWRDLFYQVGRHPVRSVYREGALAHSSTRN